MVMYSEYLKDTYKDQVLSNYTQDIELYLGPEKYEDLINMNWSNQAALGVQLLQQGVTVSNLAKMIQPMATIILSVERLAILGHLDFDMNYTLENVVDEVKLI